jgi:hypothetical protein
MKRSRRASTVACDVFRVGAVLPTTRSPSTKQTSIRAALEGLRQSTNLLAATVRRNKTVHPVKFELADQTRQAVDEYLKAAAKKPGQYLFAGRRSLGRSMTTRQYARLLSINPNVVLNLPTHLSISGAAASSAGLALRGAHRLRAALRLRGASLGRSQRNPLH